MNKEKKYLNCLVTGGAGFIGSNLVKYLCDRGHRVTVIDDCSSGDEDSLDRRAEFMRGSIGNAKLIENALGGKDVVFHLAARGVIKKSIQNPPVFFDANVMQGITLLDAMRKKGVKKIIYSSSSGVYGEPKRVPIREGDVKEPINPYGAAKLAFEHALGAYYHAFGIESVSLRYFNVYGPGDRQKPLTRAVPSWIQAALKKQPVPMYWRGQQKKDYVFVEDAARANLLAARKGRGCKIYNVGSGKAMLMRDIFHIIEEVLGRKLPITHRGERAGDPSILVGDVAKIKRELGWEPKVGLREGLHRTVEYYKKDVHGKKSGP
jgi:UDP-glucose 4-epimerase